ncbi:MAG TPA: hypothetical protein VM733_13150 [Thermoanaerobaculia bacterium]|nr:hypothetical protein [Thermoanaerobaculia bacterium]
MYQHALATALIDAGDDAEAEQLLVTVTTALRSDTFASLRKQAANAEAFEIYSSARGDVSAYVSLLNRAQLRLASLYEKRGAIELARAEYRRVLEGRSDDVIALAALARLASSNDERAKLYAEAFEANPFSPALIREYRKNPTEPATDMQRALVALEHQDRRAARELLEAMLKKFPSNETLLRLRHEAEAEPFTMPSKTPSASELRALIDTFETLTPEQRAALDSATFTSEITNGAIEGVPVSTANRQPPTANPVTYRILGVGENGVLLIEVIP